MSTPPTDPSPPNPEANPIPGAPSDAPSPAESLVKKKGVTPFEWLIVLAVMVLLAAIAIPNFVKARTTACKSACIANLKQIDGAIQQWALENKKAGTNIVTTTDVLDFLKGSVLPMCPAAGTYSVSTVSSSPTCSHGISNSGHSL
jgi:competence protein ComGC